MNPIYTITWKAGKRHGDIQVEFDKNNVTDANMTLDAWGEKKLNEYIKMVHAGEISASDTYLAYYIAYGQIDSNTVRVMSVFRTITSRSEIDDIDEKTKDKIQKLLNLAMSDNPHEAKIASQRAYALMKKHSLTKSEVEGQEFISMTISPKGARIAGWEKIFYGTIAAASGVFPSISKKFDGGSGMPKREAKIHLLGRKRDVLNVSYVLECYLREIERMVANTKKAEKMSTKEANQYRMGLVYGVCARIREDQQEFFSKHEKLHDIVPVDTRLKESRSLANTKGTARAPRVVVNEIFAKGSTDAEKIVIRKATEDKQANVKRIGG